MNARRHRLYWAADGGLITSSVVVAVDGVRLALANCGFFPGGGGQPPDRGAVVLPGGARIAVAACGRDEAGLTWLESLSGEDWPAGLPGATVRAEVDADWRAAVSRQHTALHVINAIAMQDWGAWITGCQIGPETSRIDFRLDGVAPPLPEFAAAIEARAADVIAAAHPVAARLVPEAEFGTDYLRSLEARPPVENGCVRVVEIAGFDAQACGGTHAASTAELGALGALRVLRTENKGRQNKRLYVALG